MICVYPKSRKWGKNDKLYLHSVAFLIEHIKYYIDFLQEGQHTVVLIKGILHVGTS